MSRSARARDRALRNNFGISQKQYESLAEAQNGVCFICQGTDTFSNFLAVDHCHKDGHVRGLLCRNCNRALGQFQDNIEFLERAIVYLKKDPPVLGEPEEPAPHKPHEERARWYCRVSTPEGEFTSYQEAAKHYDVHSTTIRDWCTNSQRKRAGFSSEKVFRGKYD